MLDKVVIILPPEENHTEYTVVICPLQAHGKRSEAELLPDHGLVEFCVRGSTTLHQRVVFLFAQHILVELARCQNISGNAAMNSISSI